MSEKMDFLTCKVPELEKKALRQGHPIVGRKKILLDGTTRSQAVTRFTHSAGTSVSESRS